MTKEEVIEILERFVIGAKPCSQREIVDACASAYTMLKEQPSLPSNLDEAAEIAKELAFKTWSEGDNWSDAAIKTFKAGAEWVAGQGATMEITDDTEWADLDSFVHKNVTGGSIIQIRNK